MAGDVIPSPGAGLVPVSLRHHPVDGSVFGGGVSSGSRRRDGEGSLLAICWQNVIFVNKGVG